MKSTRQYQLISILFIAYSRWMISYYKFCMTGYTLTMKRRTLDGACMGGLKQRRPVGLGVKKTKLTDGFYSNAWLYLKFVLVWAIVLMLDFVVEFRFEFLWPVCLLIRSTYDSFRYQGLAFSVLFVCISLTSDVLCYLFIPVQWLLLAASTYVWVQYVWHTERGLCLLNFLLLVIFFGTETSTRLRDVKCLPFRWDLCRPFAAHCIGYPVVTLGFGCKSYVSYKLRLRKQAEVQRRNDFYFDLLQKALPAESVLNSNSSGSQDDPVSLCNGGGGSGLGGGGGSGCNGAAITVSQTPPGSAELQRRQTNAKIDPEPTCANGSASKTHFSADSVLTSLTAIMDCGVDSDCKGLKSQKNGGFTNGVATTVNDFKPEEASNDIEASGKVYKNVTKSVTQLNGSAATALPTKTGKDGSSATVAKIGKEAAVSSTAINPVAKNNSTVVPAANGKTSAAAAAPLANKKSNNTANKDDVVIRLEADIKKIKAELQASRSVEQELRSQITNLTSEERSCKTEVYQLRQDNENLQSKLHNLSTTRQQDKQTMATLERKLADERKQKSVIEQQLTVERKKKQDELASARAIQPVRVECSDTCKNRRAELEGELKQVSWELDHRKTQIQQLEAELKLLRQYKDNQSDSEVLKSALVDIKTKNAYLENSLSSETRVKMDLFSALGEAKRQFEIQRDLLRQRDREVADLKTKIAEVMALVPSATSFSSICSDSPPHFTSPFATPTLFHHHRMGAIPPVMSPLGPPGPPSPISELPKSNLNPNACDYQPKPGSPM